MEDDLHYLDDLFKKGLAAHQEPVPPRLKSNINQQLDQSTVSFYRRQYRRLRWVAGLLLLFSLAGATYFLIDRTRHTGPAEAQRNASTANPGQKLVPGNEERIHQVLQNEVQTSAVPAPQEPNVPANSTLSLANESQQAVTAKKSFLPVKREQQLRNTTLAAHSVIQNDQSAQAQNQWKENWKPAAQNPPSFSATEPAKRKEQQVELLAMHPTASAQLKKNHLPSIAQSSSVFTPLLPWKKWNVTVFASPNRTVERLEDNDDFSVPGQSRHEAEREEEQAGSFTAGIRLQYPLTRKLYLGTGLSYTRITTDIAPRFIYAHADRNGETHYEFHSSAGSTYLASKTGVAPSVGDSARAKGTVSRLSYVNIPLELSYRIPFKRFSVWPSLGLGINILSSGTTHTNLEQGSGEEKLSGTVEGLKPAYADLRAGLGLEYALSEKLAIQLRPNARFALNTINRETPVRSFQNLLSVDMGLRFNW